MATDTVQTAAEAKSRYDAMLAEGRIVRQSWHSSDSEGRELACALGVLGPSVDSPSKCPSSVMPAWLAQCVPALFDGQPADKAFAWGAAFYGELARLDGAVPFTVFHRWMAESVLRIARRSTDHPPSLAAIDAVIALHGRAAVGDAASEKEWQAARSAAYSAAYSAADSAADSAAYSAAYSAADSAARSAAYSAARSAAYSVAYAVTYAVTYSEMADALVTILRAAKVQA